MPKTPDPGGALFTFEGGKVIPVAQSKAAKAAATQTGGRSPDLRSGSTESGPNDIVPVLEPGMTGYGGAPGPGGQTTQGPAGGTAAQGPSADYSNFLGVYGLPTDVQAKVSQIFANTPDVSQATQLALAYIRGTTWYAQTYPGIQEGIARGVITNEADYRNYLNNATQLYQRYYGRDATGEDIAGALRTGTALTTLERQFGGDAYVKANANDIQYALGAFGDGRASDSDLKALGQENSGLDSAHGQIVQAAYSKALQRLHTAFQGVLANPNLSLGPNGLSAPSLSGQTPGSDLGA